MGATFSRLKTWVAEILTASDLNAEFNNILNNLDPDGVDDASVSDAAMQATADPYPGSSISRATSLRGELQRLRYLIAQITGTTYWYQDPVNLSRIVLTTQGDMLYASAANTLARLAKGTAGQGLLMNAGATAPVWGSVMRGDSSTTKSWFYLDTAPTGWTIDSTPADALLAVKGGSNAYNYTGGNQRGSWTQDNHTHTTGDVTLSAAQSGIAAHTHDINQYLSASDQQGYVVCGINRATGLYVTATGGVTSGAAAASSAHNHGATGNGATANTWRPLAQVGIICTMN